MLTPTLRALGYIDSRYLPPDLMAAGSTRYAHGERNPRRPAGTADPSSASFAWRLPRLVIGLFLILAALLAAPAAAQAQTLQTLVSNGASGAGENLYRAQRFKTGSNDAGYTLSEIDIRLNTSLGTFISVVVRNDDSGEPGDLVTTLTNPTSLTSSAVNTFTAPSGTILKARTDYWISLHEGAGISPRARYSIKSADDQTGKRGWSIADESLMRSDEADAWQVTSESLVFALKGTILGSSAALKDLELREEPDGSLVDITPGLKSNTNNKGTVSRNTGTVTIVATPRVVAATVEYRRSDGTVIPDANLNKTGHQVPLWSYGNPVEIIVTGSAGVTKKIYTLTVRRLGSTTQQAATGRPVISGTPRVGETLTVDLGNVTDANGTYFAETGSVLNFRRGDFSFFWRYVNDDPNVVYGRKIGPILRLDKSDEGKQIVVSVCFRDDLDNTECRLSRPTEPVAGGGLVVSTANRVVTGSRCDHVYPATSCDAETGSRPIGEGIAVRTTGNVDVSDSVTWSVQNPIARTVSDEFGNVHTVNYRFSIDSDGVLHTVTGRTYPHLESPSCRRTSYDQPCVVGSIRTWTIDPVKVKVTARMGSSFGTAFVPVYVTPHGTARRITAGTDQRCAMARCYGRKLVPMQTLYPQNALEPRSVGRPPQPPPGKGLTAEFTSVPGEHDGESFRIELEFNQGVFTGRERFKINKKVRKALEITNGRAPGAKLLKPDRTQTYRKWRIKIESDSHEDVTITLKPQKGECTPATPTCTPDGKKLGKSITTTVRGPATVTVSDDTVEEGPEAALEFGVKLSRATAHRVTIAYATHNISAHAGSDYTAMSGVLTFEPGETKKTVSVPVLDDAHDEETETMKLVLSNANGAYLLDGEAIGTIENSDRMPAAWLSRFGRTVAEQVLDAVEERIRAAPETGVRVTVAGQHLGGEAPDADALEEAQIGTLSAWLAGETEARESGFEPRPVAPGELLTDSSFALTAGADRLGGGLVSLWGRGAVSRFDGREDGLSLDGEVTGALLGADWTRERSTLGLMLSHARGEGGYRGADNGEVSATVTGLYPYARYALTDRVTMWGTAGYGAGDLVLTLADGEALETDVDLVMAAAGLRWVVVEAGRQGGPAVAVKTDALGVRTSSAAVRGAAGNLAAATAEVTRLRLGLEGTWRGLAIGRGTLAPRLEVGVRHDGGDAETGFGLDLGGGLSWSEPRIGLRVEASGRGLLTHERAGFRERGLAGSLGWDPTPDSDRGPSLTLTQTMGGSASGGADALLGRRTLAGLAAHDDGEELDRRRLEVKLGYGFGALGDRFTLTPQAVFATSEGHRDYSLVWWLVRDRRRGDGGSLALAFETTRREAVDDDTRPEHAAGLRLTTQF